MKDIIDIIVITPKNDPESFLIVKLCQALGILHIVSSQPHGAVLHAEENLTERIREVQVQAKTIVIIEIPGIEEEQFLQEQGYEVVIIDHHRYEQGLDRMKKESSLEQFLSYFDIKQEDLKQYGFDPILVRGVGIIDRSFVWGLTPDICSPQDRARVIDYYISLVDELDGGGNHAYMATIAQEVLKTAYEENGFFIVKNTKAGVHIRQAISFEIARTHISPIATVLIDQDMMYVQESPIAKTLYEKFGGFMYGGEERCWGKKTNDFFVRKSILETIGIQTHNLL